jgi:hypothetical protein
VTVLFEPERHFVEHMSAAPGGNGPFFTEQKRSARGRRRSMLSSLRR